jgi:hypothetical protein
MDMVELMTRGPGLFGIGSENPTLRSCSFLGVRYEGLVQAEQVRGARPHYCGWLEAMCKLSNDTRKRRCSRRRTPFLRALSTFCLTFLALRLVSEIPPMHEQHRAASPTLIVRCARRRAPNSSNSSFAYSSVLQVAIPQIRGIRTLCFSGLVL